MSEKSMEENVETGLDLEKGWFDKTKDWLIGNWQTIIIVLIVLIIGVGLYNYQQQKGAGAGKEGALSTATEEHEEKTEKSDEKVALEGDSVNDNKTGSAIVVEKNGGQEETGNLELKTKDEESETNGAGEEPATVSSENGKAYTVSAEEGDGITNLARKALRKYLEENSVSDISNEQKIYIEDYLQNKTGGEFLALGETRSFSGNLIEEAIDMSRGLNNNDINNLSKYKLRIADL